jgi:hypothetical protein
MSAPYTDHLFRATDLPHVLAALDALRTAGVLGADDGPDNMLGDAVANENGVVTARARQGRAAMTITDPDTGATTAVPAAGDPAYWYIAIRSQVATDQPVDPTAYGLESCDPGESGAVLGVWA